MKSALYIDDNRTQVVLTPESDLEKLVLDKIKQQNSTTAILQGSFYACQGGYTRQESDIKSLFLVVDEGN